MITAGKNRKMIKSCGKILLVLSVCFLFFQMGKISVTNSLLYDRDISKNNSFVAGTWGDELELNPEIVVINEAMRAESFGKENDEATSVPQSENSQENSMEEKAAEVISLPEEKSEKEELPDAEAVEVLEYPELKNEENEKTTLIDADSTSQSGSQENSVGEIDGEATYAEETD